MNGHPLVGEAQACGFVAGLSLVKNKVTGERFAPELGVGMICRGHCFGNGLVMRAVGDRMIIAPPLTMTQVQIDAMMELITGCLDATWSDLNRAGKLD